MEGGHSPLYLLRLVLSYCDFTWSSTSGRPPPPERKRIAG
jgi:hypothetical protein